MHFTAFHPDHLLRLRLPEYQDYLQQFIPNDAWRRMYFHPGLSFSAVDGDYVAACFGTVPQWPGRGFVWALFDSKLGPRRFSAVTQFARKQGDILLGTLEYYRLEAFVQVGYTQAVRWAELLGMSREGLHVKLDGRSDYYTYARVKQ